MIRLIAWVLGLNIAASMAHEALHFWINFTVTQEWTRCSTGLPFAWDNGFYTCLASGGIGPYNHLIVLSLSIVAGIGLIALSDAYFYRAELLAGGLTIWMRYTLYATGEFGSTTGTLVTSNDGVVIHSHFGDVAWVLPLASVIIGGAILVFRLQKSPELDPSRTEYLGR